MTNKNIGRLLVLIGIVIIFGTVIICIKSCLDPDKIFQTLAIVLAFEFFVYKLLTGWLISNLNIKIETTREVLDGASDHLAIKLTLTKGSIDSLWLESINVRISKLTPENEPNIELKRPRVVGYLKRTLANDDLWESPSVDKYTLSIGEEACFSAYTEIDTGIVLTVEVLVLGTRLFYGIESRAKKSIQWRSSVIVLPAKKQEGAIKAI